MGLNKGVYIGRLVKDPDTKIVGDDILVTNFTIAVDRNYKSKGEEKPATDFIPVVAWRRVAEFADKYFKKGRKIVVFGSLETHSWEGEDGKKNYGFNIKAEEVDFADSAKSNDSQPASAEEKSDKNVSRKKTDDSMPDFPDISDVVDCDDLPF